MTKHLHLDEQYLGMPLVVKPLPALYTVYVLRSTVRNASLYVGSTPNPPRRLKQHNGETKGGARRTARRALRPWQMMMLISGFPSSIAALKFEWALTHSHLSLHIPAESRLQMSPRRKKGIKAVVTNIGVLTGVSSFVRWPLNLHFFSPDAHAAWEDWKETTGDGHRPGLQITTDFDAPVDPKAAAKAARGIYGLPLNYKPIKAYVEKANEVVTFERQGNCVHCDQELLSGQGLHAMCPRDDCTAMGHLDCWSRHALSDDKQDEVIPIGCSCPACGGEIRWADMVKELSLRIRGQGEVTKLLSKKKSRNKDNDD
ncbi:hypothetical protein CDD81_1734 [Ophiocordyceps australis]|uniref:GIY-YIG domain-containing protein n=1 Tax=Ophiocordyceps australis TaxID=1399860 RepID=A0A2C5XKE2_9HYPO|nr:hypothetical protein CDD81_1734 [Ophiocordyceps australis]